MKEMLLLKPRTVRGGTTYQVLWNALLIGKKKSHEAKLKRNKIPPKKMNDMIARWMLSLVSIHTHHKNTNESSKHCVQRALKGV